MRIRHDDYARSARILDDALDYDESEGSDRDFARLVVGSMLAQANREEEGTYPPSGHSYPRRDR